MLATLNSGSKKDAPQRVQFGNFDIMNDAEGRPLALGKGTFGRTYQARHRYLDTIVALKIINERYAADAGVRQRFLVEARAVARLSHPHIARLYDFGEVDGVLHYAMEYCGGGSLADHVAKNGPFSVGQVLEVGQQIAGALKCAHIAGFIHRDLKPSNIMLTEAKGPLFAKLIDFGLVQPSLPEATQSVSQSADGERFLGTPLFASPEQLKEEPMDVRTDLFSLGMTLWYLLLGRAPDSGSSAEIAANRLSPESYVTQLPAALPSQLRDVLARLLQKDRKNRFGSAAEVFAAFNACATALGLRRARDYTSANEPAEWDEPEPELAPVPQQVAKANPAEIERVETELSSEFKIVTRVNDDFTGSNYVAESKAREGALVFLHVLHPALVEDVSAFELLRVHMAQLKALDVREMLQPRALRAYSDYVSIVFDKPQGGDLLSILRAERVVHLVEAAPLLESIATVCDRLTAAGLPGPQLAPAHIFVEWPDGTGQRKGGPKARLSEARPKLYPRFLALSEAPALAQLHEPEDASSTMTSDMLGDPSRADNVCEHFGTLVYRIVAGRNCPVAASLSSQAYVAVPGLSEQANRLLSLVIAKQIERASCGQVLREILGAEGIAPRSHLTAGLAVPGSGSTVVPPTATPPFPLQPPPKTSTGSTASSSRFRPMPKAPSAATPPPLVVPPKPIEPAASISAASAPPSPELKSFEAVGDLLAKVEKPLAPEVVKPLTPAGEISLAPPVPTPEPPPKSATSTSKLPAEGEIKDKVSTTPRTIPVKESSPIAAKTETAETDSREEQARPEQATTAAPSHFEAVTIVNEKIVEPPSPPSPPMPTAQSAASPPTLVVPPKPIEPAASISTADAPPSRELKSVGTLGDLLAKGKEPPATKVLRPLTPAGEISLAPPVPTQEPPPKSATSTSRRPTEDEPKDKVSTTPPTRFAKKSQAITVKTETAETDPKEEQVRPEQATTAAPSLFEAVTVVNEKIVEPASPPSRRKTVPPAPVIPKSSAVQNVVPWVSRNVRPIGIGIAALLAVSLAYGLTQKIRSRTVTKNTPASSVTQPREPAVEPAKDIVPAPVQTPPNAEQDRVNADRFAAEQKAADDAKLAAQKAADDAKLAAQKTADDAKPLAEDREMDQPDGAKLVPGAETAANTKAPEAKTRTQKQAQKDSQSSGRNRTSTNAQSVSRPAPTAPIVRPPPAPRPANQQRTRSEFGASAPGG